MKKLLVLIFICIPAVSFAETKLNKLSPIEICTVLVKLESSVESKTGETEDCVGMVYMVGRSVMSGKPQADYQDFVKAYIWFSLAALMPNNNEKDRSLSWRDKAAKRLSVEEIRDAQREVKRRWDRIQRRN
jgi:hypothetical protein